jgi:hypothetical protein
MFKNHIVPTRAEVQSNKVQLIQSKTIRKRIWEQLDIQASGDRLSGTQISSNIMGGRVFGRKSEPGL